MTALGVFITGTGTDVGKTVVSAWLAQHWRAAYWKPVQAGLADGGDGATLGTLAPGCTILPPAHALTTPASPHLAARIDTVSLSVAEFRLPECTGPLVVEGAGGALVPLNHTETMADLMIHLGLPVLVVARSDLGTINHTALTVEALLRRGILVAGIVMNGPRDAENRAAIEHWTRRPVVAEIPRLDPLNADAIAALPPPCFGPRIMRHE